MNIQVPQNRGIVNDGGKTLIYAIMDHSTYKNKLKNTASIDFGR